MTDISSAPADDLRVRATVRRSTGFQMQADVRLGGHGITAIFGPSGCGKTTLLRAVAGLVRPADGLVAVNGQIWQDDTHHVWLPTHRRPLGMVFQEASLFDHMSVQGNLDFGLKRVAVAERHVSLAQAIELLGIGELLDRRPAQLSGGERQRVAIARALATSPRLLLMDEPLAALDAPRKAELLPYFERLQRELRIPMLYVTHSLDEVARLADDVLLMESGQVKALGPAEQLMTRLDLSLSRGDAASALIEGTVDAIDPRYHLLAVRFSGGTLQCVPPAQGRPAMADQRVRLRVLARDVSLTLGHDQDTSVLNILPVSVRSVSDDGPAQALVTLDAAGTVLLARVSRKSADLLALAPGQPVFAQIKAVAIVG